MTKTRNKLALGSVHLGAKFVFHTKEIFGDRHRKLSLDGQELTVVGFEPRYKNNVVLQDGSGTRLLMPLDVVEKVLQSRQVLM